MGPFIQIIEVLTSAHADSGNAVAIRCARSGLSALQGALVGIDRMSARVWPIFASNVLGRSLRQ